MQAFQIWFWFIQGNFFRTRGSGLSLYTDKHCWIRKTNMATVFGGFEEVSLQCFPFSWVLNNGHSSQTRPRKKVAIFKRSWKYLIGKKCVFSWRICVHRTSLYLVRVGTRWPLEGFFLKSTSTWHGLRHILRQTMSNGYSFGASNIEHRGK